LEFSGTFGISGKRGAPWPRKKNRPGQAPLTLSLSLFL
jgi:hypothetical protein